MTNLPIAPRWMPFILRLAAVYNLVYAIALAVFPIEIFTWLQMPATPAVMIQCIGMMVGIYALGYWVAASDPYKYWVLIAIGLLGKTLGPIGYIHGVWSGSLVLHSGWMLVANDFIWWIPFWMMLWARYQVYRTQQKGR